MFIFLVTSAEIKANTSYTILTQQAGKSRYSHPASSQEPLFSPSSKVREIERKKLSTLFDAFITKNLTFTQAIFFLPILGSACVQ